MTEPQGVMHRGKRIVVRDGSVDFLDDAGATELRVFRNADGELVLDGDVRLGVASSQVGMYGAAPTGQAAAITDPTGGVAVDAEARAAIDDILAALRSLGVIAS